MKTLYISDLDGTLLDKNARLSNQSSRIIRKLIDNGLLFTIATARSQSSLEILSELNINIPCVQLNGVLTYDFSKKQYTDCIPIEPYTARYVIAVLRKHGRMSFVYRADQQYGIHVEFERLTNDVEREFFNARKDKDYKSFCQVDRITVSDCDKVIYFTMIDSYEKLLPIHNEISMDPRVRSTLYSDNYSDLYFLEVFSSKATKAAGMLKIKDQLKADRVIAFGDNLNDIDMLKSADIGIAVGDAVEQTKQAADLIIGNSFEDGVALYIEKTYK